MSRQVRADASRESAPQATPHRRKSRRRKPRCEQGGEVGRHAAQHDQGQAHAAFQAADFASAGSPARSRTTVPCPSRRARPAALSANRPQPGCGRYRTRAGRGTAAPLRQDARPFASGPAPGRTRGSSGRSPQVGDLHGGKVLARRSLARAPHQISPVRPTLGDQRGAARLQHVRRGEGAVVEQRQQRHRPSASGRVRSASGSGADPRSRAARENSSALSSAMQLERLGSRMVPSATPSRPAGNPSGGRRNTARTRCRSRGRRRRWC